MRNAKISVIDAYLITPMETWKFLFHFSFFIHFWFHILLARVDWEWKLTFIRVKQYMPNEVPELSFPIFWYNWKDNRWTETFLYSLALWLLSLCYLTWWPKLFSHLQKQIQISFLKISIFYKSNFWIVIFSPLPMA